MIPGWVKSGSWRTRGWQHSAGGTRGNRWPRHGHGAGPGRGVRLFPDRPSEALAQLDRYGTRSTPEGRRGAACGLKLCGGSFDELRCLVDGARRLPRRAAVGRPPADARAGAGDTAGLHAAVARLAPGAIGEGVQAGIDRALDELKGSRGARAIAAYPRLSQRRAALSAARRFVRSAAERCEMSVFRARFSAAT